MLTTIYVLLLGLLCACFIEVAFWAVYPAPKMLPTEPYEPGDLESAKRDRDLQEIYRSEHERHGGVHYIAALIGCSAQMAVALLNKNSLGVLADGILLGGVFTLTCGTVAGVSAGGRFARLAVAGVSLAVALGLGWLKFLPH